MRLQPVDALDLLAKRALTVLAFLVLGVTGWFLLVPWLIHDLHSFVYKAATAIIG